MKGKITLFTALAALLLLGTAAFANNTPPNWQSSFGTQVVTGDDTYVQVNLPFAFTFNGHSYTSGYISTNGFIALGGNNGALCCSGTGSGLTTQPNPMIAPSWYDLVTHVYQNDVSATQTVFTWDGYEYSTQTSVSQFQLTLNADGSFAFGYSALTDHNHEAVTGFSPGNGASNPGSMDLLDASNVTVGSTAYQAYCAIAGCNNLPGTPDFAGREITFTPNGNNGYVVNATATPEPSSLLLLGSGLVGMLGMFRRKLK